MSQEFRVIVTGASGGVGRASAMALAQAGAKVILTGRNRERLRETASACGDACLTQIEGDTADERFCASLCSEFALEKGEFHPVLLLSAGSAKYGPTHELTLDEHRSQIESNLIGPLAMCRAAIPHMLLRGGGSIVVVLSIAAIRPFSHAAAYCSAKAGARMLVKCLNEEYISSNIRTAGVVLGATDTPLWDAQSSAPDRKRMLRVADVGQEIARLCLRPEGSWLEEITLLPPEGVL